MSQSTNLQFPYLQSGQAQKHVTVNESLLRLDALVQLCVVSASVSSQPGAPSDGELYVLPAGKTGAAWDAMANGALAYYRDGAWEQITPRAGFLAFVQDEHQFAFFDGSAWRAPANRRAGVCDGRLTLESGEPVPSVDRTARTVVYFTPYNGNQIGLYSGAWVLAPLSECSVKLTDTQSSATISGSPNVTGLSDTSQMLTGMGVSGTGIPGGATIATIVDAHAITLSANATATGTPTLTFKAQADSNFDVFAFLKGGVPALELCKWTDATTRASAIARQDGVAVKSGDATRRLLGTVRTTSVAGETEVRFGGAAAGGAPASLLLDNVQNKVPVTARVLESTASWTYATNTDRPYNNSTSNRISFVRSLPDDRIEAAFNGSAYTSAAGRVATGGIGLDVTNAVSSTRYYAYGNADPIQASTTVTYKPGPLTGFHYLQAIERANSGASVQFYGGSPVNASLEASLRI